MIIPIKPITDFITGRDCIQSILHSVCISWNLNYEMTYAEAWKFNYTRNGSKLFGERLEIRVDYSIDLMHKIHGIEVREEEGNSSQLHNSIVNHLLSNSPVLIYLDAYWTPWGNRYLNEYHPHFILIVGFNESTNHFYCVDPVFADDVQELPIDHFIHGNNGRLISIHYPPRNFKVDMGWDDAVHRVLHDITVMDIHSFEQFMEDYLVDFDFRKEFEDYENYWEAPFYTNINQARFGRKSCVDALSYLNKQVHYMQPIIDEVMPLVNEWSLFRNIVKKMCLIKDDYFFDMYHKQFDEKIQLLFQMEKEFIGNTKQFIERVFIRGEKENNKHYYEVSESYVEEMRIDQVTFVPLTDYFNNKAFKLSEQCEVTVGGDIDYIAEKSTSISELVNGQRYQFPELGPKLNDNIACYGQMIPFPRANYQGILLIATAERGECTEKAILHYKTQQREVELNISDGVELTPLFNEKVIWQGVQRENRVFSIYESHLACEDDELCGITVPYNPSLHIFSISLY